MDAALIAPPRRLSVPIDNRWGAGDMSVLDFGDEKRPVDLIFVHANGFNAATYRSLLAPLSGSLRIWAPDLRGHGRTRLPTTTAGRVRWHDHRDDLIALLDAVDGPPLALAGHSMGGTSSLLASAERPAAVSRLVMLDPVIMPRHVTAMFQLPFMDRIPRRMAITRGALKRRRDFDSREQALASWRGRGAFKGWSEMMLADYVSEAFEDVDGGVRLVCTPEWEASNYASQSHNPWRALRRFDRPIRVLKAGRGSTCALTPGMHGLPNLTVETVTEGTHLFPMLMPDIARDALFEATV